MNIFEEMDKQLAARGWHYDRGNAEFRSATPGRLEWEEVIGLVSGLTQNELARLQDDKFDHAGTATA